MTDDRLSELEKLAQTLPPGSPDQRSGAGAILELARELRDLRRVGLVKVHETEARKAKIEASRASRAHGGLYDAIIFSEKALGEAELELRRLGSPLADEAKRAKELAGKAVLEYRLA